MPVVVNPLGKHRKKRRHHGEGTVIERTDRWRAKPWAAVVPYRDASGRRREKWLSATSRAEAEARRRDFLHSLQRTTVEAMERTVSDQVQAWLGTIDGSPSTHESYRADYERRIKGSIGGMALSSLKPSTVRAAVQGWAGSASTRSRTLTVLRAALRQAVEDGTLLSDPTRGVKAPSQTTFEPVVLDAPEARMLLDAAKGERFEALLTVTLGLGLRRGEAFALRSSDYSGTHLTIAKSLRRIPAEFRGEREGPRRLVQPKADSGRTLPVPAFVSEALDRRLEERTAEKRSPYAANDFIFCDEHGNAIAFSTWARWFTAVVAKAGLPPMRPHDLRHSTATLLLAEGVPERTVQAILGHRSGDMTRRYLKALPRMTRDAADRLDRAIG